MTEQMQAAITTIVGVLIANWVTVGPALKNGIVFAWKKTIEWEKILTRLDSAEKAIVKLEKDLAAAHSKIRDLTKEKTLLKF